MWSGLIFVTYLVLQAIKAWVFRGNTKYYRVSELLGLRKAACCCQCQLSLSVNCTVQGIETNSSFILRPGAVLSWGLPTLPHFGARCLCRRWWTETSRAAGQACSWGNPWLMFCHVPNSWFRSCRSVCLLGQQIAGRTRATGQLRQQSTSRCYRVLLESGRARERTNDTERKWAETQENSNSVRSGRSSTMKRLWHTCRPLTTLAVL